MRIIGLRIIFVLHISILMIIVCLLNMCALCDYIDISHCIWLNIVHDTRCYVSAFRIFCSIDCVHTLIALIMHCVIYCVLLSVYLLQQDYNYVYVLSVMSVYRGWEQKVFCSWEGRIVTIPLYPELILRAVYLLTFSGIMRSILLAQLMEPPIRGRCPYFPPIYFQVIDSVVHVRACYSLACYSHPLFLCSFMRGLCVRCE